MRLSLALLPATMTLGLLLATSATASPASPDFDDPSGHAFASRFPVATTTTAEGMGHPFASRFPVATASPVAETDDENGS